ncbi:MAG: DMT family transporter, partial [Aquabacterium sp.]|nr:DMT family transporter [Aquabacterium sp.]
WAREKLSWLRALGLGMSFAGVALLASDGHQFSTEGAAGGAALALGSTLMYAFAVHYNKRFLSTLSPLSNSAGTLAMASALLVVPAIWVGPQPVHAAPQGVAGWAQVPSAAWAALLTLTVLCTGVAYLIFYRLIDRIGASRALTVTFLIPVFGMMWGALFLGERVTVMMTVSTAVILLGTWLSNQGAGLPAPAVNEAAPRLMARPNR